MKKSLLILLGALLLAGCGTENTPQTSEEENDTPAIEESEENTNTQSNEQEAEDNTEAEMLSDDELFQETEELGEVVESSESTNNDNLKGLPEFDVLANEIDLSTHSNLVKTDNKGNRVILFESENGVKQYKSVFVKYKNRLKIIDLPNDNLIFNEVISTTQSEDTEKQSTNTNNDTIKNLTEYNKVAEHIDLDTHSGKVQTDNRGNRVIIYSDANGHKKYKSIFIKNDNRLKIVHFDNDGLIFNQPI